MGLVVLQHHIRQPDAAAAIGDHERVCVAGDGRGQRGVRRLRGGAGVIGDCHPGRRGRFDVHAVQVERCERIDLANAEHGAHVPESAGEYRGEDPATDLRFAVDDRDGGAGSGNRFDLARDFALAIQRAGTGDGRYVRRDRQAHRRAPTMTQRAVAQVLLMTSTSNSFTKKPE